MGSVKDRAVIHFFEMDSHKIEVIEADDLREVPFGEYLIERRALSRQQLFTALQEQDKYPEVPLGEIVAALGYLRFSDVDRLLCEFKELPTVEVC